MHSPEEPEHAMLQAQLLRYAEDLQQVLDHERSMESRFQELDQLAHYDALTGLPNRLLLHRRLEALLTPSRRPQDFFTLMFVDLDGFKKINDTLGHAVGDQVLKTVAQRLQAMVRDSDTVARLGGDEFVIIARSLSGGSAITAFCEKTIANVCQPMQANGQPLTVGISLGCAEYPRHGDCANALLEHADASMYQAKMAGGSGFAIFDNETTENSQGDM
jgi:diguanylate cyclase (GGDEF)-like protein